MVWEIIIICFFSVYALLLLFYWKNWQAIPIFIQQPTTNAVTVSVIIPARNEAQNIGRLLSALQQQCYPSNLIEVIVVDDHSTDATAAVVKKFSFATLLSVKENHINSYKKKAIETGIAAASGQLIVTTDADCLPTNEWLQTIVAFKEKNNSRFIAAPVSIQCNASLLQVFQAMDFMVLQGITGAVVSKQQMAMCNGANLAYERQLFYDVNGFKDIDDIASGDDMLLMQKIVDEFPAQVHYLKAKEAIVSTFPALSWKSFFQQRIRWASKATKYNDKKIFAVLLFVYLFNFIFLCLLIASFIQLKWGYWFLALWGLKTIVELPLFVSVASFFNKRWAVAWFFVFQPLHIFYTIISGLFAQFGKYEWKGRRVK